MNIKDQFVFLPTQEAEIEQFLADNTTDLTPVGALEHEFFLQALHAAWNLRRLRIREAQLLTDSFELQALFDRLRRSNESSYHRALSALRFLQTNRLARDISMKQTYSDIFPRLVNPNRIRHKISRDGNIVLGRKLRAYKASQSKPPEPTAA